MARLTITTAFGTCAVEWNPSGIIRFELPPETGRGPAGAEAPPWVQSVARKVTLHLGGMLQDFSDSRLDWSIVSAFQAEVYRQTQSIPPGHVRSYGEVARAIGLGPESARAVGVALATNPWPLLVPCHRVVSARGRMTGFSAPGGIRTKTRLLALEGAELLSE